MQASAIQQQLQAALVIRRLGIRGLGIRGLGIRGFEFADSKTANNEGKWLFLAYISLILALSTGFGIHNL